MYIRVYAHGKGVLLEVKGIGSPGCGVINDCEPLDIDAESQIQVACNNWTLCQSCVISSSSLWTVLVVLTFKSQHRWQNTIIWITVNHRSLARSQPPLHFLAYRIGWASCHPIAVARQTSDSGHRPIASGELRISFQQSTRKWSPPVPNCSPPIRLHLDCNMWKVTGDPPSKKPKDIHGFYHFSLEIVC